MFKSCDKLNSVGQLMHGRACVMIAGLGHYFVRAMNRIILFSIFSSIRTQKFKGKGKGRILNKKTAPGNYTQA